MGIGVIPTCFHHFSCNMYNRLTIAFWQYLSECCVIIFEWANTDGPLQHNIYIHRLTHSRPRKILTTPRKPHAERRWNHPSIFSTMTPIAPMRTRIPLSPDTPKRAAKYQIPQTHFTVAPNKWQTLHSHWRLILDRDSFRVIRQ